MPWSGTSRAPRPRLCSRQRPRPRSASSKFFTAQINNGHTRKAYLNATRRFAEWGGAHGIRQLADVQPDWRQLEFPATTNRNPRFFRADPDHEDMVKDQQVRRLVKLRKNEKTLTRIMQKI